MLGCQLHFYFIQSYSSEQCKGALRELWALQGDLSWSDLLVTAEALWRNTPSPPNKLAKEFAEPVIGRFGDG